MMKYCEHQRPDPRNFSCPYPGYGRLNDFMQCCYKSYLAISNSQTCPVMGGEAGQ